LTALLNAEISGRPFPAEIFPIRSYIVDALGMVSPRQLSDRQSADTAIMKRISHRALDFLVI
jgi:hypothetical protein